MKKFNVYKTEKSPEKTKSLIVQLNSLFKKEFIYLHVFIKKNKTCVVFCNVFFNFLTYTKTRKNTRFLKI